MKEPTKEQLIDQIRKLATEWNEIIGHPENPFPEDVIDEMVEDSFKLIGEKRPPLNDFEE